MNLFKKLFFVASLSLYVFTAPSFADNKQIYVDNHLISLKEEIIVGDSVLVPLRDVCENLGYNVSWYGPSRLIHLKKNFHDILIDLKNEKVFVNNNDKGETFSTNILNGRTYVSLDVLNNILCDTLTWDTNKNLVSVKTDAGTFGASSIHYADTYSLRTDFKTYSIPQIINPLRMQSIDKINAVLKEKFIPTSVETSDYIIGYNQNDIISVCPKNNNSNGRFSHQCYTFNLSTGEELKITDILNGTNDEILNTLAKLVLDSLSTDLKKSYPDIYNVKSIKRNISNFTWFIDKEDIVFFFDGNQYQIHEYRLNMRNHSSLLKTNLCIFNDPIEEAFVKQRVNDFCVQKQYFNFNISLIDKTAFNNKAFYVFLIKSSSNENNKVLLVDRSCDDFYLSKIDNNLYVFSSFEKYTLNKITDLDMYKAALSKDYSSNFYEVTDYKKDSHGNTMMELTCLYNNTKLHVFDKITYDLSELSDEPICNICTRDFHGYLYTVPYININSSDAYVTNLEIDKLSNAYFESYRYSYSVNDNTLSLIISLAFKEIHAYNFDLTTGNRLSNADLLQRKNLSSDEFLDKLHTQVKNAFLVQNKISSQDADRYLDEYKKELLLNCSLVLPIYLSNDTNKFITITRIPSINKDTNSPLQILDIPIN
ncbi:MAG: copper amine oxidase N-terminal domain-containing protein [Clostridiales bacterium]|nr:copper amine oxidase N-terminal domain-containing protein [Clostridiales bacterium]